MISHEEARARIVAGLRPLGTETVALDAAGGRVLAAPVIARITQPPAAMAAMDGYAVRAADAAAGARLRIAGEAAAGRPFAAAAPPGAAVRVFTGSVMPAGADAVVMQEDCTRDGDFVTLRVAGEAGRHVRPAGQDFAAGEQLLAPGRRLTARDIGLAAAAGQAWLCVRRRPRVAILSTGDELALPGEDLPEGGIYNSNSFALAAMVRAAGGTPVILPPAADSLAAIAAAADAAAGCDLLVTAGGASVGEHDLVQAALASRGMVLDFWKVAMRPGKPMLYGRMGDMKLLGLPGNPVSALVCGCLFLLPALAVLAGETPVPPEVQRARLTVDVAANDRRADFLRARLAVDADGALRATPFTAQASSLIRVLADADGLIMRPPLAPAAPAGAEVPVLRFAACGL